MLRVSVLSVSAPLLIPGLAVFFDKHLSYLIFLFVQNISVFTISDNRPYYTECSHWRTSEQQPQIEKKNKKYGSIKMKKHARKLWPTDGYKFGWNFCILHCFHLQPFLLLEWVRDVCGAHFPFQWINGAGWLVLVGWCWLAGKRLPVCYTESDLLKIAPLKPLFWHGFDMRKVFWNPWQRVFPTNLIECVCKFYGHWTW